MSSSSSWVNEWAAALLPFQKPLIYISFNSMLYIHNITTVMGPWSAAIEGYIYIYLFRRLLKRDGEVVFLFGIWNGFMFFGSLN